MINFSGISRESALGKFLRMLLAAIPSAAVLPVMQGRLKGKKWVKGAGVNGYWLGTYESGKQKAFQGAVKKGDVVFDIGAHAGFYTLLASIFAGENGKVFAFEPLPRNVRFLKKHINMNKCGNVEVLENAVSDKNGQICFLEGKNSFLGKIADNGSLSVDSVSLDKLFLNKKIMPPNIIKIDVEGGEFEVLAGARKILTNYHPKIFLAVHSSRQNELCGEFLASLGYSMAPLLRGNNSEFMAEFKQAV